MKTNITILTAVALLVAFSLNAQVAINTDGSAPDGSAILDIQSSSMGTSFPNLNIDNMSTAAPVSSPKTGLIAYNTNGTTGPGLVMWTGSRWVTFELQGTCWSLTGNAGTTPGDHFIGTTDPVDFVTYTNNAERMRVMSTGEVVVNSTSPYSGDIFSAYAGGSNYAINGYSSSGPAIYGEASGNYSVWGSSGYSVASVRAHSTNSSGTGVLASGNNLTPSYLSSGTGVAATGADGVYAKGMDSNGNGIIAGGNNGPAYSLTDGSGGSFTGNSGAFGYTTSSNGTGIIGACAGGAITTLPSGSGGAFTGYHGVFGKGSNTSNGIGVIGVGNDSTVYHYVSGGNGGAFSGAQAGVYGYATKTSDGTGVIGVGNRNVTYKLHTGIGSGGAFSSDVCGVYGYASNDDGDRYGGYFEINNASAYAWVGARFGTKNYKTIGNGTNSTIVKGLSDEQVVMFCPEAPEVLFQDYGIGKLQNGKAHIILDPILSKNIQVDESHPLKVFIQLEGDCNGVYVTNKSANSFDVIELQTGTSNVEFSWQIVATRANEEIILRDGSLEITDYSDRFPTAPNPPKNRSDEDANLKQGLQQKITESKVNEKNVDDKKRLEK